MSLQFLRGSSSFLGHAIREVLDRIRQDISDPAQIFFRTIQILVGETLTAIRRFLYGILCGLGDGRKSRGDAINHIAEDTLRIVGSRPLHYFCRALHNSVHGGASRSGGCFTAAKQTDDHITNPIPHVFA